MKKLLFILLIFAIPILANAKIVNYCGYKLEDEIERLSVILDIPDSVDVEIYELDPWLSQYYYGLCQEINSTYYVVYLNMCTYEEEDPVEVLAHELVHVSDMVHGKLIHLGDKGYIYDGVEYVYETDQSEYYKPMETKTREKAAEIYAILVKEGICNALADEGDEEIIDSEYFVPAW